MERYAVARTSRIRATEDLIRAARPRRVLEIGGGDHSFRHVLEGHADSWLVADFAEPADILCDLNSDHVFLPLETGSLDLVICTQVVEHLLWPQALLGEIRRVLGPYGKLLISVPNVTSLTYRLAWLLGRIPSCAASGNLPREVGNHTAYRRADGSVIGGHVIDFNPRRLRDLLTLCGFSIDEYRSAGIVWHHQILPGWMVPASLSSVLICLASKHDAP